MKKLYRVKIYFKGHIVTTATGEDQDYLERWARDVCTNDEKATYYTIEGIN